MADGEVVGGTVGGAQAFYYAVSGADASTYDTTAKVALSVANGIYDDAPVADVSSFCQFTNAADKANYVKASALADYLFPDGAPSPTNLNYTVEAFFKARGAGQRRKTVFKFGTNYLIAHEKIDGDDFKRLMETGSVEIAPQPEAAPQPEPATEEAPPAPDEA